MSLPIISRLYSPSEFGQLTLFLSFFGLLSAILSWRYESAVFIANTEVETHILIRIGKFCILITSFLSTPVLYILITNKIFGFEILPVWLAYIAFPTLLGHGLFLLYRAWVLRSGEVQVIARATVIRSGANAGTKIGIGAIGFTSVGLFIGEALASWLSLTSIMKQSRKMYEKSKPTSISTAELASVAKKYIRFVQFELPSTLLDQLSLALPVVIIASTHGAKAAGWFGLAKLIVAIPNAQIGRAVGDVFQYEVSAKIRLKDFSSARKTFYLYATRLAILAALFCITIVVVLPMLTSFIFGSEWQEMGRIAALIAPWFSVALVVSTLSRVLSIYQRQKYKFVYDLTVFSAFLGVYFVSVFSELGLNNTIILISIVNIIGYIVYFAIQCKVVNEHYGTDNRK